MVEKEKFLMTYKYTMHIESPKENFKIDFLTTQGNYDNIVSTIITKKYPSDKMQAVVNNYLLDPEDETIKQEFQEMQAWRAFAKEKAKEALTEINTKWGNNTPTSNEEETN